MILKIVCLSIVLIVFFFVIFDIMIDYHKEKRAEKERKKIGDFTIKEYALLCKKYLKKGCKDCPFLILNDGHCISTLMYPAGIPFNNTIERKEK